MMRINMWRVSIIVRLFFIDTKVAAFYRPCKNIFGQLFWLN
jgi:hypothetical protein